MALQPNSPESPVHDLKPTEEAAGSSENLALLYQGILTGITRLKIQRQHIPDSETFRRRTKATLEEVERVAVVTGYDVRDVRDTHFAVVAFLDSVILHSKDPVRAEWERKTLQQELFGQTDAGVVFFKKLDQFCSRRDSEQLADILEVYLLCLLLGFEGRYSGGQRGELEGVTDSLRMRIEYIRGREDRLSPSAGLPPALAPLAPLAPAKDHRNRLRLVTLAMVGFTFLCYWILKLDLVERSEELRRRLL
jgi:type IV/VI secretion system ImpK/VasF family protein